jgi:hypothetical protein
LAFEVRLQAPMVAHPFHLMVWDGRQASVVKQPKRDFSFKKSKGIFPWLYTQNTNELFIGWWMSFRVCQLVMGSFAFSIDSNKNRMIQICRDLPLQVFSL